jgi:hypothetical protein
MMEEMIKCPECHWVFQVVYLDDGRIVPAVEPGFCPFCGLAMDYVKASKQSQKETTYE